MSSQGYVAASFEPSKPPTPWIPLLLIACWFGLLTGFCEGLGLLIFQRINWARWGPTLHVSEQILWISPLVDMALFLLLAIIVGVVARSFARLPAIRILVFLLTFLTLYDWLSLSERLYQRACIILALGIAAAFIRWLRKQEPSAMRFWKATLPWLVALLAVVAGLVQVSNWLREENALADLPIPAPGAPNVLVIVVDTLRADRLSSYGCPRPTSPNIDSIAQQGVLFENAVSASSWTLPSHASLLTGRSVSEHGIGTVRPLPLLPSRDFPLGSFPTLPEALEQKGYRTAAFSANRTWFVRDLGFGQGFMHFEDYFQSPEDMFARTFYGRELLRNYVKRIAKDPADTLLRYGRGFGLRKRADVINDETLRWIDRGGPHPFFAFLNYLDVHDPYGPPSSYPAPPWPQQNELDRYDAGVRYVDDFIGRLLRDLEDRGLAQNTLLVITSDHGEALGQHGMEGHGRALYWETLHVPLLIRYPGHIPTGRRISVPVSNASIPATVMDLLGENEQNSFPTKALSATWKDSDAGARWPEPVSELVQDRYSVQPDDPVDQKLPTAKTGAMNSLVTSRWHLMVHEKLGAQIYDWTADPGETANLIATPDGQKAAGALASRLKPLTRAPDAENEKPAAH